MASRSRAMWTPRTTPATRGGVTLPVERLAEYGADRRNEEILRAALGEDAAGAIIGDFSDAQLSRTSYLRQYRTDLSVNRDRDHRSAAAEVSLVTVVDGQEPAFERAWRRGAEAYRTIAPGLIVTVARTLVGGGPQFVIARPVQQGLAAAGWSRWRLCAGRTASRPPASSRRTCTTWPRPGDPEV